MDELRKNAPIRRSRLSRSSWKETTNDGLIQTTMAFQAHENKLYVETTQPNRKEILEENRRWRQHSKDHKRLKRGLSIPEEDFPMICQRYPELLTGRDKEAKVRAMERIAQEHPEYVSVEYSPKYHAAGPGRNT